MRAPRNDDEESENKMTKLSDATRTKLKTVSTATVATALFKRGFRIQMIQDVQPLGPGQPVFPGDVILGDTDGVIVIPAHLADEIADEAVEMTAFEDFVTEEVRKGRSILGLYPATDEQTTKDFAAWRKANGR